MNKDKMIEWIGTHHVGISSKTMWVALMCNQDVIDGNSLNYNVPCDADDFSRCYDLYKFAELNLNDLRKIEYVFPYWKPIIDEWYNLESVFLNGKGVGDMLDSKYDEVMYLKGYTKTSESTWERKKQMKNIYTLCETLEEADALGHFIMGMGYEGVQNDSYRYCKLEMEMAFQDNARHYRNYIFVGVNSFQLVVGKNKREMRKNFSYKYIEKERIFKKLLSTN
jgi:hypothetical protein